MDILRADYILFLDDLRIPLDVYSYTGNPIYLRNNWKIVRDYNQFVSYIQKNGLPKAISFDHDLGCEAYRKCIGVKTINYEELEEKTGYHAAKWLVEYCMDNGFIELPTYYIHTMNPVGGKNIQKLFINYTKHRND